MRNKMKFIGLILSIILIITIFSINSLANNTEIKIDRNNDFEKEEVENVIEREEKTNHLLPNRITARINKKVQGPKKPSDKKTVEQKIKVAYEKMNFPKEYKLSYIDYDKDEQEWEAKFEEEKDGIKNIYKGIKLKYSELEDKIVFYKKFNQEVKQTKQNITKEFLKQNERKYIELMKKEFSKLKEQNIKFDIENAKLEYIKPNTLMRSDIKGIKQVNKIIKAWKVEYIKNYYVYIDAENGNIIGGNYQKYAEALAASVGIWGVEEEIGVDQMVAGYTRLGYKAFGRSKDATTPILRDWIWRGGPQYAFYFSGHGNAEDGQCKFVDKNEYWWKPSDIRGNWDFVFIDACSSRANDTLANGFKIYNSSSNKAYLGWNQSVGWLEAARFTRNFAQKLGTKPIQRLAKETAENMPEYAPIRFTGDRNWYGRAR